jgi:hypothetical protein
VANVLATVEGYFQIATTAPDVIPRGSAAGATRAMTHRLLDAMPARESASAEAEPDVATSEAAPASSSRGPKNEPKPETPRRSRGRKGTS